MSHGFSVPVPEGSAQAMRREQVRAVGTAFLRLRPAVVAVGIVCNAGALVASAAPTLQRAAVLGCMGLLWVGFVAEAWALRHRIVTERWLLLTLIATFVALSAACAMTGGVRSPLLPLLFAPLGVGFAAYGAGKGLSIATALALLVLAALAWLPLGPAWPRVAAPWDEWMTVVSAAVTLVLLRVGVGGLSLAHAVSSAKLDRLRGGALLQARQRALQSEALAAKVAHELKNPLTSIKGLLQLLERATPEAKQQRRLHVALDETERMQRVLDDYLSFARAPAEPALEPLRLDALLHDLVLLIEPAADAQGVQVAVQAAPLEVAADAMRLKDALLNLVANALDAMPQGGTLRLALERRATHALIVVSDTGVGMSSEQLQSAGTPFVTHRQGGTGLGLAIARGVARQHGGELELESAPQRGARATLSLRMAAEGA